jgi:uncharacterized protein (DUF983 family)
MLFSCKCPACGQKKQYIAEQVGTAVNCDRCGHSFPLPGNPGRVIWQIVAATLMVIILAGFYTSRAYFRAHRWDRIREQRSRDRGLAAPAEPRLTASAGGGHLAQF